MLWLTVLLYGVHLVLSQGVKVYGVKLEYVLKQTRLELERSKTVLIT